jgi:hypothetical protein
MPQTMQQAAKCNKNISENAANIDAVLREKGCVFDASHRACLA